MDLRWSLLALVWSLLGLVAFALFVKITRSKDRPASPNNKNNMDLSKPQVEASSSSSSSAPSSSSSIHSLTHDVFLSFRGPDTRNNFTGHLYRNLVNKGIKTFIDDGLTRGEDITKELLEVIEGSRISVIVFSANYASSKWCLDELVKIIQCKEFKQQIVYPIFYKVDPSEIRYQKGQVGEAIARLSKHKDNLKKVESWKVALAKAATLFGWCISEGGHEVNLIDEIVKEISTKIMKFNPLDVATYPVGIESRVEDILKLLNVGKDDPHMIGIWGIGGIGKTTLAKAVYNSISHKFEHCCFLANVREESFSHGGLVKLQNNFLSKIIERNPPNVTSVDEGIPMLKQKLSQKSVLLVLDDVDQLEQLRKLAGKCDWFGPRSRIIITTRDVKCLRAHNVNLIYGAKELNDQEASELFNFNALKGSDDFSELATEVIHYAKGIPLVLEVLGSDLCSKNKNEWKDALEYYRRHPNEDIQRTLQRSYEALERLMREVFLHIACFFKGYKLNYVIDVLQSCDLHPMITLRALIEKALIRIEKDNSIWMHDLLEDMGKEIVWQESLDEIGKRSRLWLYEDVREVLEENTGIDKIKAIMLRRVYTLKPSEKIRLNGGSFTNMKNLQIFIVSGKTGNFFCQAGDPGMLCGEGVDYLSNQLRVLEWMGCPLRSLQESFNPTKLGMLRMSGPGTTPVIKGLKNMRYLKSIQLDCCPGLTRIPDLSGLTILEYLELSWLSDLVEVHPSVGRLDKLVILKLTHCVNLQMFQERINLESLKLLDLYDCANLKFFPEIEGDMKSLNSLDLGFTAIKELPCSVGNLTGLKSLSLYRCFNLTDIPSSIFYGLQRLESLFLAGCSNLVTFPTKSESLPPPVSSTNLSRLQVNLAHCGWLEEISEFPLEIHDLDVSGCNSLERISKLSKILEGKNSKMFGRLDLTNCRRLCDNLARGVISGVEVDKRLFHLVNKRTEEAEELMFEADGLMFEGEEEAEAEAVKLTALLTLFFSCAKSEEFQVEFSTRAPIPNWFTCRQDGKNKEHEFCIEIPQNSNWDNKGLALCFKSSSLRATLFVYINGIKFDEKITERNDVWVHYIPLVTVIRRLSEYGMPPPDMFRVMFRFETSLGIMTLGGSWGVHLIEDLEGEGRW